jgi:hypothetical protein
MIERSDVDLAARQRFAAEAALVAWLRAMADSVARRFV